MKGFNVTVGLLLHYLGLTFFVESIIRDPVVQETPHDLTTHTEIFPVQ